MKFLILGDVHTDWTAMNITIAAAIREHPDITHIVQVGDFGYGWPGKAPFKPSKKFLDRKEMKIYQAADKMWLDGNHENHSLLEKDKGAWQPGWRYMPRGSVLEVDGHRVMFFGGAYSVDKDRRTPYVSWWPEETIKYGQVQRALQKSGPIDAIFSHEHPKAFPYSDKRYDNDIVGFNDKRLLDELRKHFKPQFWFFGHHHYGEIGETENTKWCCCPIIETFEYTIWDGDTVRMYRK